ALAAYHAGESAVAKNNQIPPIIETEQYVKKVMEIYGGGFALRNTQPENRAFRIYKAPNGVRYFTNISPEERKTFP
ncbi:hypothetical protein ACFLU6_04340, partial [Acidobacteriota bacterium]